MNIKGFLFATLLLSGCVFGINAQIVDGFIKSKAGVATNRIRQNANKEVDKKIEDAVDKEFDKHKKKKTEQAADSIAKSDTNSDTENSDSKSKNSKSSGDDAMSRAIMGKMGINMTRPANMKDSYEYTGNIKMDVETWNEEGESQGIVDYTTRYSEKNNGFAMEFNDKEKGYSTMIYDFDGELMVILSDDGKDKSGFATPLSGYKSDSAVTSPPAQVTPAEQKNVENYTTGFKKTGKSKTIAGYKCDEYYYENEEDMVSYWMTTDLPAELWTKMGTTNAFASVYAGQANGFVMESDQSHKNSKDRSHMIVKEVNPKQPASISTVGYTIMTMNAPPASSENKKNGGENKDKQ